MAEPVVYPVLPKGLETRLAAVEIGAKANKNYFKSKDCPYSPELIGFLKSMVQMDQILGIGVGVAGEAEAIFAVPEGDKFDVILREVEITIQQMKDLEQLTLHGDSTMDSGDKIQLLKAKTAMLEKWSVIKEKIYSSKEVAEFQSIIVSVMDELLTKDQRLEMVNKLRSLRSINMSVGQGNE